MGAFVAALVALLLILSVPPQPAPRGVPAPSVGPLSGRALPIPPEEELRYSFGWQDAPAATVSLRYRTGAGAHRQHLEVSYHVATTAAVDWLWSFRATGTTLIDAETLLPVAATITTREKDREKQRRTTFDHRRGVATIDEFKAYKDERDRDVIAAPSAHDVASALVAVRVMRPPAALTVLVGDDLYEVTVRQRGSGRVEVPAGTFDAHEWSLEVRELDEDLPEEARTARYRSGKVWVARRSRLPLRLEAEVFVGRITAELVSRRPQAP
ncbi:MAG: DUF3108 domain-containing protein [Candidatus Brocadiaceae bacterium]|jgi:hypothetical protein